MYTYKHNKYASLSAHKRDKTDTLIIDNRHCRAEIALFGAHILSFTPKSDGIERIWLSESAVFDKTKPIRGGVPICWPWFADIFPVEQKNSKINYPAHGFVRAQDWKIVDIQENEGATTLTLCPNELGLFQFPSLFSVTLEVTFSQQCSILLITKNKSEQAVEFTAALHSYFKVSDITDTEIKGIAGKFIDKTHANAELKLSLPYLISTETDRIHLQDKHNSFNQIEILSGTHTKLEQSGHDSLVIWNPWIEKSQSMPDMDEHAYRTMLCAEASVTKGITLLPDTEHRLRQVIS